MSDPSLPHNTHPDDAAQYRYALEGPVDDLTREVAVHLIDCEPCREDVHSIQFAHRSLTAYPPVPAGVVSSVRSITARLLAGGDAGYSPADDGEWFVAEPVRAMAGYRVARTDEYHLNCTIGDSHLDVLLHPGQLSNEFAVSGQILRSDGEPAEGLPITLLVNHLPSDSTRTNGFGEFEFGKHRADHFGLRLGDDAIAPRVELWSEKRDG